MNNETCVLFVSASTADMTVLTTLLAREDAGDRIRLSAAHSAADFYDALYAEHSIRLVVIDQSQGWSDWQTLAGTCARHRRGALLVLLTAPDQTVGDAALEAGVAAVYPRSSAGMIALSRLIGGMVAQESSFSLRQGDDAADAGGEPIEEERERLVHAVSHDLQDPLQLARRYAEILNEDFEGELGEAGSKVLGHLQFNLGRTQDMLDELLDYSRLQSSRPDKQWVDFNELLEEVTELYRLTLDEIGGSISRQHDLPTLLVDRRQFLRVLQNLIGNAIKFRSEQPLQILVRAQQVRNEWRIGIKDNGVGIADADARRIFGMFERADTTDDHAGTGMGLAISKRIVQNHGGRIWVRSSPGNGSVFIFSIPQADESAGAHQV